MLALRRTHSLLMAAPALLFCAAVLLMHPAADYSLWYDEAWQVRAVQSHTIDTILETIRRDYAPPAYFLALSVWSSLTGEAEPVLRYLSALCAMLTAATTYRLVADLYRSKAGGAAAAAALATMPFFIRFANEVRMYAMLAACVAGSMWLFRRCLARSRWATGAGYVLVTAAALYTHYLGAFLIPLHFLYAAVRRARWRVLLLPVAAGLLFLPWLPAFLDQLNDPQYGVTHDHALPTDLDTISRVLLYDFLSLQPVLYLPLLAAAMFTLRAGERRSIRFYRPGALGFLAMWGVGWLALAWGSNLLVPQFQPRNALPALPALAILIGAAFARMPGRATGLPLQAVTAALLLVLLAGNLVNFTPDHGHNPHYRDAVAELARGFQPGDVVFWQTNSYLHDIPMQYYLDRLLPAGAQTIWLNPLDGAAVAAAVGGGPRFWLLQTLPVDNRWIDEAMPHVEASNVHVDAFQVARYELP
ncbi:MAG: glycosyltransferase family 39 protein [Anaerolineae bacterium]|nr:glycosyltransferase family 39 protein [Anaerolineae bacterium]